MINRKESLDKQYESHFTKQKIKLRTAPKYNNWNYWLMSVELENRDEKDGYLKETNERGVMTRPIWQLLFRLPIYSNCEKDNQENTKYLEQRIVKRIVNIPSIVRD